MSLLDAVLRVRGDLQLRFIEDHALLASPTAEYVFSGGVYAELLRAFATARRVEPTVHAAAIGPMVALQGVEILRRHGVLVDASTEPQLPETPGEASPTITGRVAIGGGGPTPWLSALARRGLGLVEGAEARDVTLVPVTSYREPSEAPDGPWLPVATSATGVWFGPIMGANGACMRCTATRVRWNRPVAELAGAPPDPWLPRGPVGERSTDIVAEYVAAWIADRHHAVLADHIVRLDAGREPPSYHRVHRLPQCASCGDPDLMLHIASRPVVTTPQPVRFDRDGGYRVCPPQETLRRCGQAVDPVVGAVLATREHASAEPGLPALHTATFALVPAVFAGRHSVQAVCYGKGLSPEQARTSALCEAVERRSALAHGDEHVVVATGAALGPAALPPERLQLYSAAQRAADPTLPPGALPDEAIRWALGWSLVYGERRYLPFSYCYHGLAPGQPCSFSSNGHAAGNCLEEAILQGFLELVERDAVAIWWYNRVRRPAVRVDSFGVAAIDALLVTLAATRAGHVTVLDLTTDLGVPVFAALADRGSAPPVVGFGAHFDARVALGRALTELVQLMQIGAAVVSGAQPWVPSQQPQLRPLDGPGRLADDFALWSTSDLQSAVAHCRDLAAGHDLDLIVVDQSRPELPLHAAKVVAPSLCHLAPQLGPGRLYDVPVRLGWLDRPHAEDGLNPRPILT